MSSIWNNLSSLPVEVYGSAVLSMLELKSCVKLHSAADKAGVKAFFAAMSHFSTPQPIVVQKSNTSALKWLNEGRVRGLQFRVTRYCGEVFDTITQFLPLIDSITLDLGYCWESTLKRLANSPLIASKIVDLKIVSEMEAYGFADFPNLPIPNLQNLFVEMQDEDSGNATVTALAVGHYPQLKKFVLSACNDDELGMELVHLVQGCPLLEELWVKGVPIEDTTALALAQMCGNLRILHCDKLIFTDAVLNALVAANPPLCYLNVDWAVRDIDAVHRAAPLLCRLQNYAVETYNLDPTLEIHTLAVAVQLMTGLQTLSIEGSPFPTQVLESAAQGSACLHNLCIKGGLSDEGSWLGGISQHNPQLRQVAVSGMSLGNTGLQALAAHCPRLEKLYFSCNSSSMTDAAVIALAEHCPELKILHMNSFFPIELTDASVLALAKGCPALEDLDISCTDLVTEGALLHLVDSCPRLCTLIASASRLSGPMAQLMMRRAVGRRLRVVRQTPCHEVMTRILSGVPA